MADQKKNNLNNGKIILGFVSILVFVFIVIGIIILIIPQNSLSVNDQPLKESIIVAKATLTKGGFVVLRPANQYNKIIRQNIATTHYLYPGTYKNIPVDFIVRNQQFYNVKKGDLLFAVLIEDSNYDQKSADNDAILTDLFRKQVSKAFRVY